MYLFILKKIQLERCHNYQEGCNNISPNVQKHSLLRYAKGLAAKHVKIMVNPKHLCSLLNMEINGATHNYGLWGGILGTRAKGIPWAQA